MWSRAPTCAELQMSRVGTQSYPSGYLIVRPHMLLNNLVWSRRDPRKPVSAGPLSTTSSGKSRTGTV